jgi:hypothetical protein
MFILLADLTASEHKELFNNMTDENLNPQEEVKTTPPAGSESEETDLESLFADEEAPEGEQPDDKVARLEKTVSDLKKGIAKAFSDKGRETKEVKAEPKTDKDDVNELFYAQKPEAELVESDLKQIADAKYNGSILKAWKNETWLQDKAKAMSAAKKIEEESKSKISKPSSATGSKVDFSKVKTVEEYKKLTPDQRAEYNKLQKEQEVD